MTAFNIGDRVRVIACTSPKHSIPVGTEATVYDGSTDLRPMVQFGAVLVDRFGDRYRLLKTDNGKIQALALADIEAVA